MELLAAIITSPSERIEDEKDDATRTICSDPVGRSGQEPPRSLIRDGAARLSPHRVAASWWVKREAAEENGRRGGTSKSLPTEHLGWLLEPGPEEACYRARSSRELRERSRLTRCIIPPTWRVAPTRGKKSSAWDNRSPSVGNRLTRMGKMR